MRVVVVDPPQPVIQLEDAKQHLRILHGRDNDLIEGMIDAATAMIDGPDGWLGRCIGIQTLEARFDDWAGEAIRLPCPPAIEIESVEYRDAAGVFQTLDPAAYRLAEDEIERASRAPWPPLADTATGRGAVRVRYTAGYDHLPPPIRVAILMMVGDLYRYRGTRDDSAATVLPVEPMLQPFRVYV